MLKFHIPICKYQQCANVTDPEKEVGYDTSSAPSPMGVGLVSEYIFVDASDSSRRLCPKGFWESLN